MKRHKIIRYAMGCIPVAHCGMYGWWGKVAKKWMDVTCLRCLKNTGRRYGKS